MAPPLLKEVNLNIKNDDTIQLKSEGSWKINEKLIFLLSENGIPINANIFNQDDELDELMPKILSQLNLSKLYIEFTDKFENKKGEEIKNTSI